MSRTPEEDQRDSAWMRLQGPARLVHNPALSAQVVQERRETN